MLTSIQSTLSLILKKKGIQNKIKELTIKEKAERVAHVFMGGKIKVLTIQNKTIFLKTINNYCANEIRMKENVFLQHCRDVGVLVYKIKYTI